MPVCLLLSGGTFLYAACIHILPETLGHRGRFTRAQVAEVTAGAILPLVLAMLHPHSHTAHTGPLILDVRRSCFLPLSPFSEYLYFSFFFLSLSLSLGSMSTSDVMCALPAGCLNTAKKTC